MGLDFRWDDVRLFLAAMRTRTLAGAGARLGVDASTVSRRLAALETSLGARLFDRTRDGLEPTLAAEQLLAAAEELEAAGEGFSRAAAQLEGSTEGVVRLSALPGFSEGFLVPALGELAARYPKLRLELDTSPAMADLTRREADLAIRSVRPTSGDLIVTKLLEFEYAVFARADLAAQLGELSDATRAPWIDWTRALAHLPEARWLSAHAPEVEPFLRSSSLEARFGAVAAGLGLAVLPCVPATARGLARVPLRGELAGAPALPRGDLWLVGHRALREVPRIAAVWSFLLELAARPVNAVR